MGPIDPPDHLTWDALAPFFPGLRPVRYLRPLPQHDLIYVKNPKAACSTVLVWLDRLHTGEHDFDPHNVHREHRLPTVRDVGRGRVCRMLSGEAYRFSFVRHPLRRLESVYWDKIVAKRHHWRPDVFESMGLAQVPGQIPFEQFLALVEQQDPVSGMDPHWRPQHVNLILPLVEYDHVGHVETFGEDLERIREEAGLPVVPSQMRNASAYPRGSSVFDGRPDLVRRVEALYAEDFELFGY